jgi:hypothetical protein
MIPGSYPTAPPASYSKPTPLMSTQEVNAPMPPLESATGEEEEEEEDDELEEVEWPWINTPLYPGQFVAPPTIRDWQG